MGGKTQSASGVKERIDTLEPEMYDVVLLNDDFTTMEFVIDILMSIFYKPYDDAYAIMMKVHQEGEGIAGTYTYDLAKSKITKASEAARFAGYPLRLKLKKH